MTALVDWLIDYAVGHSAVLGAAGLAAVAFIAIVISGVAGRITLVLEEFE